jgi:LCP family protein required for cell wall assembly
VSNGSGSGRRSQQAPTTPRHGRLRKSGWLPGFLIYLGVIVAVIAVSATSVAGIVVWQTVSDIKPGIHLLHVRGTNEPPPQVGSITGPVNLLLTGSDTRTGQAGFQDRADLAGSSGTGNNDVTMVMHISADHQHATIVSIPRDLLVNIPACPRANGGTAGPATNAMFNTTLSRGGLACTVLTAETLTGLDIQYAAEISFDGVISMSNVVGGVQVCLATPIKDDYVGLNLPAGEQTIQGGQALAFLRSRHGVGDGSDLGRISDQQLFMSSLMRKLTSAGVLSNPITLYQLATAAVQNMQLSDSLTAPTTMVSIALALKNISLSNVVFVEWPTKSNPAFPGRVVAEQPDDRILAAALDADQPVLLSGKLGRATVNGAAPPTPSTSIPTATGTKTATATPTPTSTAVPVNPVALPGDVTGQTAAQQTCAKAYQP